MLKSTIAAALIALALSALATLSGCNSDPSDTHIRTGVTTAR